MCTNSITPTINESIINMCSNSITPLSMRALTRGEVRSLYY